MRLLAVGFSLCLLWAIAPRACAQYQNPDWIEFSPPGESFRVSMPNQARSENENLGAVNGKRYTTITAFASYTIWSLANANYRPSLDTDKYLDSTAELVWEGLLKPARDNLDDRARLLARMTYVRELSPDGLPGREYTITVGDVTGTTEFFVAHDRIYVMLALGKPGGDWPREKFFASFRASDPEVLTATKSLEKVGVGAAIGGTEVEDNNRIFSGKEVTEKVRVLEKREPTYTESARKFGVQGTVVLRGVFSKDGEVTNLHVVRKLPHGLTEQAVNAARAIRFTPATKDGQAVSMWMELQYNFNLY